MKSLERRSRSLAPIAVVLLSTLFVGCISSHSVKQPHGIAPSASVIATPGMILTRPTEITWEIGSERLVIQENVRSVELKEPDEEGLSLTSKVVSIHERQFHDLSLPEQVVVDGVLNTMSLDGLLVLRVSTITQDDPEMEFEDIYTVTVVGYALTMKPLGPMSVERADRLYADVRYVGDITSSGDQTPTDARSPADTPKKD